ncbi:4-oxalocrotonate decarboxylase [Schinkia azotoformans MEV2011]|uniref:4-oxalocrotonate decarboxylase n=1 Tax=Schinkia azotoformans MEV2011 TaxID=1348973 RepID=A0A072NIH5_SCHAZ|nr:fumarylacetoacetate hydrolase family protein [Schinkia azotoformans]KEF37504.1 4-oxalocrotonate decarboxylase [Schinkia azotoformans MEV2011]MEC1697827.1 fumarylacetoacetate hydrolase family protein [Schinkia azotoformans]MEC1715982.1 fumarylacetoacetate hydrolase family protein [Schinkia azotoformans]MEC1720885.1 fumarylacetoacetate hydrolase family protein [Schinkia azotoformans]MEC1726241.1 fumarylacetoacetate hydrolase family protein [Schinkia azotoformans]
MITQEQIKQIATYLQDAEYEKREVVKVTASIKPDLTFDEAYLVQEEIVRMKLAEGKKIVGPKMGLTSYAKMKQMGVDEPIYGYVFDYMLIDNGGQVKLSDVIHPKVEAEIAFVMGEDVEGPGVTGAQVLAATEYVLPALEVIDSRYENFNFTFPDVVADNASTSRVVFGTALKKPDQFDLELVGTTITINGEIKELGAGAAVLGHPANSVAMLANMLARKGEKVKKGDIILTGGITGAVMLSKGDVVSGKFDGLGEVTFTVVE